MNPVPEAETVVVGAAPEEQHDAKDNQPKNGNDLDRRKPELGFSEKGDRDDIENQDDYTPSAPPQARLGRDRSIPTRIIVIHAATGTASVQYSMIRAAAVTSEAINIENEYLW